MNDEQTILLGHYIDEAMKLHAKLEDVQKEIADFYTVAADSLNLKAPTLKKLVKYVRVGDKDEDPALKDLIAILDAKDE